METAAEVSGLTLKLERVASRLTATSIGRAMGVSNSRIGHIESSAFVTPGTVARYRAAIATCVEERTSTRDGRPAVSL